MTVTGSARFHRRNTAPPAKPKNRGNCYPVLLSCCLFLAILCACLLAALVLIGKHFYQNGNYVPHEEKIERASAKKDFLERLPNDTKPIHYNITLMPDLEKGNFKGEVNITLKVKRTRRNLVVHSKNLTILQVNLYSFNDSKAIDVLNVEENEISEMVSVISSDQLLPGVYYLTFKFNGNMLNKLSGFYRSQYRNQNSSEMRTIATSKFEPTYARQAFPCFDEPEMKAKYSVHIQAPTGYFALSNMPGKTEAKIDAKNTMVHFEESVKMSTYLSCFIVCDFNHKEETVTPPTSKGDSFTLRVYATPAQTAKTDYALRVAKDVILYFITYFDIAYPLPKLDLIAIPDFVSGAMEHWGLVTFRETALLYDPSTSSSANKQRVASVVSHELAHSWFGNLVTMKWWNDLWLNEGFASYIQYKGVHEAEKDWQMLEQFQIETLHPVLSTDATPASHPIVQTVITPDQITEVFDGVVYSKGASILRMLEHAVTETVFQKGVREYLKKNAYGNAVTQDLLNELQKEVGSKLNVTEFVDTWIVQKGYPILTVETKGDKYILTQKRFLKNYENAEDIPSPYNYKWTIPVTYGSDKPDTYYDTKWLKYNDKNLEIEKPAGAKWIKFNRNQIGYYRVNYSPDHWKVLIDNIGEMTSTSDKTHLLEESFSIAESGDLSYDVPLGLTKYLLNELNYIPWSVASSELEALRKYLIDSAEYSKYLEYITRLLLNAYKQLTWSELPSETHLNKRARVTVLGLACSVGHEDALTEASKLFKAWLVDPVANPVLPDLRSIVYHYGMVKSSTTEWEKLLEMYKREIDANEKLNMLRGLAAVKEPWLLKRLIELGKLVDNEQIIRGQDYFTMLQYISNNPIGTPIVWDYVRENWQYLVKRFTLNDRYLGRLIPAITKSFVTEIKLKEMLAFFEENSEAGAGQGAREEALANVRNNIKWVQKNQEAVEKWIRSLGPTPHSS